jgi:hypothetical protein
MNDRLRTSYNCIGDRAKELENCLQRELNLPCRICATNGSKRRVGRFRVWYSEVCVIQKVEELRPKLQPNRLTHLEALVDGEIPLLKPRSAESVPAEISERGASGGRGEYIAGEKRVYHRTRTLAGRAAAHIRPQKRLSAIVIGKTGNIVGSGWTVDDIERRARVRGVDARQFPSTERAIHGGIHMLTLRSSLQKPRN